MQNLDTSILRIWSNGITRGFVFFMLKPLEAGDCCTPTKSQQIQAETFTWLQYILFMGIFPGQAGKHFSTLSKFSQGLSHRPFAELLTTAEQILRNSLFSVLWFSKALEFGWPQEVVERFSSLTIWAASPQELPILAESLQSVWSCSLWSIVVSLRMACLPYVWEVVLVHWFLFLTSELLLFVLRF